MIDPALPTQSPAVLSRWMEAALGEWGFSECCGGPLGCSTGGCEPTRNSPCSKFHLEGRAEWLPHSCLSTPFPQQHVQGPVQPWRSTSSPEGGDREREVTVEKSSLHHCRWSQGCAGFSSSPLAVSHSKFSLTQPSPLQVLVLCFIM